MKLRIALLAVATSFAVASTASADQPYSPKKASPSSLIRPANYQKVPIKIPNFSLVSTKTVVNGPRVDFELSYDAKFWDMVGSFEKAFHKHTTVSVLDSSIFPNAKKPDLYVYGMRNNGQVAHFTLGHPDLPYRFDIVVKSDDQANAVVVVHNAIYSLVYSGVMPARTGFKPAGHIKEIPFRWN